MQSDATTCEPASKTKRRASSSGGGGAARKKAATAAPAPAPIDPLRPRTLPEIAFTRNHISRNVARKRFVAMRWELVLMLDVLRDYRRQCEAEEEDSARSGSRSPSC